MNNKSSVFAPKITIRTSEECNSQCKYCHQDSRGQGMMTLEQAQNISQELRTYVDINNIKSFRLKLFGGEPLTNPSVIPTIIGVLKENEFVSIITNGTLPDALKTLLPYKDQIGLSVSIDGTPECHFENRSIMATDEFMRISKEFRNLSINFVISPTTADKAFENFKYILNRYNPDDITWTIAHSEPWTEEQRADLLGSMEEIFKYTALNDSHSVIPFEYSYDVEKRKFISHEGMCCGAITIFIDGTIAKCPMSPDRVGSRLDSSYVIDRSRWHGKTPPEPCISCDMKELCIHCSVANDCCPEYYISNLCLFNEGLVKILDKYYDHIIFNYALRSGNLSYMEKVRWFKYNEKLNLAGQEFTC